MTRVNLIEFQDDGTILIRYKKDNGEYHRTSIPPSIDANRQLQAVDDHLATMNGISRTSAAAKALLKNASDVSRSEAIETTTPEVPSDTSSR